MSYPRIAWLLTSAFYYWHPMLSYFAKLFPETTAFVANWRGYAPGFENSFSIQIVGQRKIIPIAKDSSSYGINFTYLPLNIAPQLLKFKPHVIFSNSFGMWTVLALLLKPLGQWRVVIAYEGSSPGVDYRHSPWRLAIRKSMVKTADACITNSQAGKAYLIDVLNTPCDRVFVYPYEVPAAYSLSETSLPEELPASSAQHPIFLYVGSLIPRKGIHHLLEACTVLQQHTAHPYTLLVVGDGPQRPELEDFCEKHNLMNRVCWIGRVDYEKLGAYFSQADVFVLPTLEDTWGMVVLEAMVFGKAVLCSQEAGASELISEGANGFCFNPYEPEYLATLMQRFIDTPDLARVMGQKSAQLMKQYSPEASAQFLKKVTSFVLAKSGKPPVDVVSDSGMR
jgi:glycosyltransferase involved in cell wall biosynthesis